MHYDCDIYILTYNSLVNSDMFVIDDEHVTIVIKTTTITVNRHEKYVVKNSLEYCRYF